ncbi:MAG: tetratricopeptide repeat protein [Planctomycetota bacterium]|nr:MAG: tetratricopeptide repeat protein [Planctomycetota bacterium]
MATATLPEYLAPLGDLGSLTLQQVRLLRRVCEHSAVERRSILEAYKAGQLSGVPQGICAYALDFIADADEALAASKDPLAQAVLGLAYISVGELEDAERLLRSAAGKREDAQLELARLLIDAQSLDAAEAVIKDIGDGPDAEFIRGRLEEAQGNTERAIGHFEAALEQEPEHVDAAFKLGVLLDRIGDDDMAIEYYLVCSDAAPPYLPGVINLGILYDERGESNAAIDCFRQVLAHNAANRRARMLLRDAKASRTMYYDEHEERQREQQASIFKTPVNDFELSVRSRNCLAKMNIFTLGDLVSITETEMLNYKNFGETSLKEVQEMLDARGLRLGYLRDDDERGFNKADQKTLAETIERMELSSKTVQVLERLGVGKIGDLLGYTDVDLYRVAGSGQSVVQELSTALGAYGLSLPQPEIKD